MQTQMSKLGRYDVLDQLGRGATGAVLAARDRQTGTIVALKTINYALLRKPASTAELFLDDARAAWRLKHPNIVAIQDAGEADGEAYVATEMLDGDSLEKLLDEHAPIPIARAIKIAAEIAHGLAYAHEQGVVHRGIKPSNIMILRSGGVKITDFGVARIAEAAIQSGQPGACLRYMSPEQIRGDPVDARSDIFSLGAVLYEMLTRRPPFQGASPDETMQQVLNAEPPLPSDVNPHVPRALDGLVLSMLAERPEDRIASAHIVIRDLERLAEHLGYETSALTDATVVNEPPQPARRAPDAAVFHRRERRPAEETLHADGPRFAHHNEARNGNGASTHEASAPRRREAASEATEATRFNPDVAGPHRRRDQPRDEEVPARTEETFRERGEPQQRSGFAHHNDAAAGAGSTFPYRDAAADVRAFREREAAFILSDERETSRVWPRIATAAVLLLALVAAGLVALLIYFPDPNTMRMAAGYSRSAPATTSTGGPSAAQTPRAPASIATPPQVSNPFAVGDAKREQESRGMAGVSERATPPLAATDSVPAPREQSIAAPPKPAAPDTTQLRELPSAPQAPMTAPPAPSRDIAIAPQAPSREIAGFKPGPPASAQAAPLGEMAKLILVVSPRGEVYIDGRHAGTAPPMTSVELTPGMHQIEVRNGSWRPFLTYMTVQPGEVRRIRHEFGAKSSRPPS